MENGDSLYARIAELEKENEKLKEKNGELEDLVHNEDKKTANTATVAPSNVLDDPGHGKRTKNQWYSTKKYGTVKWLGKSFSCKHGRQRQQCKECGGSQICEHGRQRSLCKECGGSEISAPHRLTKKSQILYTYLQFSLVTRASILWSILRGNGAHTPQIKT